MSAFLGSTRASRAGSVLAAALLFCGLVVATGGAPSRAERPAGPAARTVLTVGDPVRVRQTYRIAGTARVSTVLTGNAIRIVGSVATKPRRGKAKARPVVLAERAHGRWTTVARTRSTRVGAYAFTIKAGSVARTRVFRVRAARFNGLAPAATKPLTVRVVKPAGPPPPPDPETPTDFDTPEDLPGGYVGAGSASDWTYLFGAPGSRWDPCTTIRWAYNPSVQGYDALADVKRAFAKISGVSGLRFKYVGTTTWRYLGDLNDPAFDSSAYDIAVGWADATELPDLAGGVVGFGGGSGSLAQSSGADVKYLMSRGYLILDDGDTLPGGFDQVGWGPVMLHEILHSLGLGHAAENVQLMHGFLSEDNVTFDAGDITGMTKIGAASGCLS